MAPSSTASSPSPRWRRGEPLPGSPARIGAYTLVTSVRRDALGEVLLADGPDGGVRVRLLEQVADLPSLASQLRLAATVEHPAVAPAEERLTVGEGVALVGALDHVTLAERRRLGRLGTAATMATGTTLLEGLVGLHAAGVVHGAVDAALIGIDTEGHPRWRDAGLWPARRLRDGHEPEAGGDVRRFAELMRDLGTLPPRLAAAVEAVASGAVSTPTAAGLVTLWRECAREAGLGVPPAGATVRVAALLPPQRRARRPPPRWVRLGAAGLAALCALGLLPAARLVPGGAAPLLDLAAYLPDRPGAVLTYGFTQDNGTGATTSGQVQLRVGTSSSVAGVRTVELVPVAAPPGDQATPPQLPLGLGGATLRVEGGSVTRVAPGGTVRDLVGPLRPGLRWTDARQGEAGFVTTETRVALGPTSITEPAGRFDQCVVIALASVVTNPAAGARASQAAGFAWYCKGVGLTRVLLVGAGEQDVIDLNSVS